MRTKKDNILKHLIYVQKPTIFDDQTTATILATSRHNNDKSEVTGALICRHEIYLQFLEGPKNKIDGLYDRICGDDRHVDVCLLLSEECPKRLFPEWSMKHDPLQPWMWTRKEMENDNFLISRDSIMKVFQSLAAL